jgi:hypothetical protein
MSLVLLALHSDEGRLAAIPAAGMFALRRFETSLKRLKCANSGHSSTAWRTDQGDPKRESEVAGFHSTRSTT